MANRTGLIEKDLSFVNTLKTYETCFYKSKDLLLICWKDSKTVFQLTNMGNCEIIDIQRRKKKAQVMLEGDGGNPYETVTMPKVIADYTQYSKGVDLFDQLASYYNVPHRSRRWYIKIIYHMLEIALVNSFVIFKKATNKYPSFLEFRKSIARGLVADARKEKNVAETKTKAEISCLLKLVPSLCRLEKKTPKKTCNICKEKGEERTQSSYWCAKCKVHVCITPCYDAHLSKTKYHKNLKTK